MNAIKSIAKTIIGMPRAATVVISIFLFIGVIGPLLLPHDTNAQDLLSANQGPGMEHWLGTDHLGRDVLSRLILAARTSLTGISLVLGVALFIGIGLGTLAGFRRGYTEMAIMRIVDVGQAIPSLIVALAVIGIFGTSYTNMIAALALAWWPGFARISRGVAITLMNRPHIEALRVLGASPLRIYFRHLLPGTLGAVLVYATADAGGIALSIATLSFLGLGVQPPTPEWGQMLVDALPTLEQAPLQVILPGLALTLVVIGFNLLGEAIALNRVPEPVSAKAMRRAQDVAANWAKEPAA